MRFPLFANIILALLCVAHTTAALGEDDSETNVVSCDRLPFSASIEVFSKSDTLAICREMLRILEDVRASDINNFSKAVYVLSRQGYKESSYSQIARELVDIVRLRGLYGKRARWLPTVDLVVRCWSAFHGIVSPADVQASLRDAGPRSAKALSDDGLTAMIIIIKQQRQSGDD
jgi:hypothetical protein